jgi:hypothetical protein
MKKSHMKISKFWNFETKGCKGNDFSIKSLGYFLNALTSKNLTINVGYMCKKYSCEKTCLVDS